MTETLYHKLLRVSALSLAFVLLFVIGVISPLTKSLSESTGSYLATAIGINAAVVPTEVNTLSAQLEERDRSITEREIAVNLKEANQDKSEVTTYILSILLFILLTLIILNYVLDFIRAGQRKDEVPA